MCRKGWQSATLHNRQQLAELAKPSWPHRPVFGLLCHRGVFKQRLCKDSSALGAYMHCLNPVDTLLHRCFITGRAVTSKASILTATILCNSSHLGRMKQQKLHRALHRAHQRRMQPFHGQLLMHLSRTKTQPRLTHASRPLRTSCVSWIVYGNYHQFIVLSFQIRGLEGYIETHLIKKKHSKHAGTVLRSIERETGRYLCEMRLDSNGMGRKSTTAKLQGNAQAKDDTDCHTLNISAKTTTFNLVSTNVSVE